MSSKSSESGLDELMRLSRETARMGRNLKQKEQQKTEHDQKLQGVVEGLREISFSVALEQLKLVATPETVEEILSLKNKQGTKELRRLISRLTRELEALAGKSASSNPDMVPIANSIKTLAILISLLFSLQ
ncbi:hypothetical protein ACFLW0_03280 [Chloroflexota bacterium]